MVQRHGGVDRAELVDRARVNLDDAVPAIVLAADALQVSAHLGILDVQAERPLQRGQRAVDVLLAALPHLDNLVQVDLARVGVLGGQRIVRVGELFPRRRERLVVVFRCGAGGVGGGAGGRAATGAGPEVSSSRSASSSSMTSASSVSSPTMASSAEVAPD